MSAKQSADLGSWPGILLAIRMSIPSAACRAVAKSGGADQGLRATVRADFVNPCGECQVFFILGSWRGAGSWAAALELASQTVKVDDNRQQG